MYVKPKALPLQMWTVMFAIQYQRVVIEDVSVHLGWWLQSAAPVTETMFFCQMAPLVKVNTQTIKPRKEEYCFLGGHGYLSPCNATSFSNISIQVWKLHIRSYNVKSHWKVQEVNSAPEQMSPSLTWFYAFAGINWLIRLGMSVRSSHKKPFSPSCYFVNLMIDNWPCKRTNNLQHMNQTRSSA